MRSPRALTNLADVLSTLSEFQSEEAKLSNSLTELLSSREPIVASLNRLQVLVPRLDVLQRDALSLSATVSATAKTAERVGGRVQSLDEEMRRVREAGDRVSQVMELRTDLRKTSLSALQSAIDNQDWESATRHCARAMSLPEHVICGSFAETAVPTVESHLPPAQTLQAAREHLLAVFRQQFEQASRSRDSATTSRFFKLFPEIGWEEEGLQAYAAFVVDLVRVRAPASAKSSSPLYYITALTALFESIALIVDQHQPVVEKYYGQGKMQRVVERLLEECDRVVKGLIENWEEERSLQRKLSDIAENPPIPMTSSSRRQPPVTMDEESLDPRDIDKVVSEVAGMTGRWNLFKKFVSENLRDTGDKSEGPEVSRTDEFHLLEATSSQHMFEEILKTKYTPLEVWYFRTTIDRAQRLSSPDTSQMPVITTAPDDVFYLLKLVLSRLLSTGSVKTVEMVMEQLRDVMDKEYVAVIKKKLDDVYRNSGQTGQTMRADKIERENRAAFIILLNDLDVSMSHLDRLSRDLANNPVSLQHFTESQTSLVKSHIAGFATLTAKIRTALRSGIEQLFNQLLRPKLRNLIGDVYKDVSYVLDEEAYASAEYQDVIRKRFIKAWEALDSFTDANYRLFFGLALDVLVRPWEKFLLTFKFTELGAIRFDRDLRAILTYLSTHTAFGDAREKFVRLQQLSTILNLDNEEDVDEFYNGSGITWKLSTQEARAIAALKV
ncbi:unnamed protein product [Mycena citricolor]|uniref:Conserved oligomeric Golgi complex subunit 4 n=1 Tax=Mycena citricolor TaxID=2018698 RepID=A0AAD2Q5V1_9AGAR|nr:unnamed protein product [Mycena citricolor]